MVTLEVALLIFVYFEEGSQPPAKRKHGIFAVPFAYATGPELPENGTEGIQVTAFKSMALICAMDTVVGVMSALQNILRDIPLDRLSTHPLENFFGLLRKLLHVVAHNCMVRA
jgi:hypothetical protein